jgi:SAM-dependent methyltransferase
MRFVSMLRLGVAALLALGLGCARAPARPAEVRPRQPDVPFVRTHDRLVDLMLGVAGVTAKDQLYDLGCGDGRIVIAAATKHGARGVGVDIDPKRVAESRENARRAGVTDRVSFMEKDLFETDVAGATVVTLYLLPEVNLKLRPKLLAELRPGARVASHQYDMGEWRPDRTVELGGSTVYLWVIPARVEGEWTSHVDGAGPEQQGVIRLRQRFQDVTGSARAAAVELPIEQAALRGAELSFLIPYEGAAVRFQGRVDGDTIHGTAAPETGRGQVRPWTATRRHSPG